ncbi:replication/maintenance protein RepL [Escherichia coli]|nr:replication/maintenance protein RepL [Escherichia coli]EHP9779824.1 replication/maintenance protein RepL [Escherichia coli]EHQ0026086.1 replication/maintenance protein RepL [Escherichia coli]EHQ0056674.1 replication/maintenance protein RepL [Escherichia coli]
MRVLSAYDKHGYHFGDNEMTKMPPKQKIKDKNGNAHYVGRKMLTDLETGEQFEAQTIIKSVGDKDFKKIFIGAILDKIDAFSTAKLKFILWLIENADKQNRIIGTFKQLSDASGVSFATVARLMPMLREADILRLKSPSVYLINPDLVTSVSSNSRQALLVRYKESKQ